MGSCHRLTFQPIEPYPRPMIEVEAHRLLRCELPPGHRVFINAACPRHPPGKDAQAPSTKVNESKPATSVNYLLAR